MNGLSQVPADLQIVPALSQPNGMAAFHLSDEFYLKRASFPEPAKSFREPEQQSLGATLKERWEWLKSYMNESVPCPELESYARVSAFCLGGPLGSATYDALKEGS